VSEGCCGAKVKVRNLAVFVDAHGHDPFNEDAERSSSGQHALNNPSVDGSQASDLTILSYLANAVGRDQ
jgi:hypothetical protein